MNSKPFFSIIVPVYKVEEYLPRCVESLLAQDYDHQDYEIILVDDGSPDNCPQLVDKYAAEHDNIIAVHKPNGGLSDARNKGTEVSRGQYLTYVDSDDFLKNTEVLSDVRAIIDRYNPDIVVNDIIKYYTDNDKYLYPSLICDESLNGKSKIDILRHLYFDHADLKISASQKFMRRDLAMNHPFVKGLLSEDIDWTLQVYSDAKSICLYGKPYYCYRQQRAGSISTTASTRSFGSILSIIDDWQNKIPDLNVPQHEKEIYLGYLSYQLSILLLIAQNLPKEEKPAAYEAIRRNLPLFDNPLNFKTTKVKKLISILGVPNASRLLSRLQKLRVMLHR